MADVGNPRHIRHQLVFTGRIEIAGSIAGLEIATKIAWYYLHERVWAAIGGTVESDANDPEE
ncbi:MAG TPA: DUF2061 domain-containing protein [Bradyrhizobium sp.]|nr:DUF2061 domain-containing protein [Bradyrhizobium sp.]